MLLTTLFLLCLLLTGVNDATIILMICVGFYQASCNIRNVWAYQTSSMPARVSSAQQLQLRCCSRPAAV
jgi:hypothetical protein